MPPRYAYWTILIDSKPTAFRATKQEELQPTLVQLQRTNPNVVMKWFARGKLWENPEQAQWAGRNIDGPAEQRGSGWRPGGSHEDPRARFDRKKRDKRGAPPPAAQARSGKPREDHRAGSQPPRSGSSRDLPGPPPRATSRPPDRRPPAPFKKPDADRLHAQGFKRPFGSKPPDRTYPDRPDGRRDRKPFPARSEQKPAGAAPAGGSTSRPTQPRPLAAPPQGRTYSDRPHGKPGGRPQTKSYGDRPRPKTYDDRPQNKPFGTRPPAPAFRNRPPNAGRSTGTGGGNQDRTWTPGGRPPKTGARPWSAKPAPTGGSRPWSSKSSSNARSGVRPDRPPFQHDARRQPKPFNRPGPGATPDIKKRKPTEDEE